MFARPCFLSHFKDFSRTVRNSRAIFQQCDGKFSTSNILSNRKIEDESILEIQTNKTIHTSTLWKNLSCYIKKNKIRNLAATGLLLNLNDGQATLSSNADKADLVTAAADQTVAKLLDTNTQIPELPPEAASVVSEVPTSASVNVGSNIQEVTKIDLSDSLPEPPPIPEIPLGELVEQLNALGQPTFASMGLGGWTPVGLVQNCFEYLNVTLGIPWWETILLGTLVIRLCLFPLVVIAQRNAAKMNNNLPGLQALQLKLTDARQTGNQLEVARYSQEMMLFMKEKEMNPLKNMLVPLAQMPVFISFFMALRQMTNVPVESLTTGGLWWFTDLTLPDQFFIMPLVTSLTLYATIELGTDSAKLTAQNMQTMKYVFRALPVVILPFTINFPGAILVYWTCSNFISLAQVGFLRLPRVREYFKIEKHLSFDPQNLPIKPKGFTEGLKESWSNMKVAKDLEERRKIDEMQFKRAGKAPLVKTYKYDPTQQIHQSTKAPISAKKR